MCGILAILRFDSDELSQDLLARMRDTMLHRGPDDAGLYISGSAALAHRRLSIIDLSENGKQPLTNEDGSVVLVFNGEIYNYLELRRDLVAKGHRFRSTSDSEVIVHQYEEDGEKCLDKFIGMFGFALFDRRRRKLFAARDRIGIKPLYYYCDRHKVLIASEIKAIIEDPSITRAPDYQALSDYMFAGRALGDKTLFRDIKELPPGHILTVDQAKQRVAVRKYWDVHFNYRSWKEDQLHAELLSLLDEAVEMHCRSDAPLGCHLSGGLDSSTITALASKHVKPLRTFSVKFSEDSDIDETRYAKAVVRYIGAEYHESSPSGMDLATLLPSLIWHMDVPMATDGGFAYYAVSRLARNYAKVTLTGHGGDELFGGYPAQFFASFGTTDMFPRPKGPNLSQNSSVLRRIVTPFHRTRWTSLPRKILDRALGTKKSLEDIWIQSHCGYLPSTSSIFHRGFLAELQGYSPRDEYIQPFRDVTTEEAFDKCLYHDLRIYLPSLLHQEDRVSMALSIESRVPFLDHRIVELLATVRPEQKVVGLQPKFLLRKVASRVLPEEVWQRKEKFPFPVPKTFWSVEEVTRLTETLLRSSTKRGMFTQRALIEACNREINPWPFINLELWFKIFIDKDPFWTSQVRFSHR